jgi:type III secretory pathway component EscS
LPVSAQPTDSAHVVPPTTTHAGTPRSPSPPRAWAPAHDDERRSAKATPPPVSEPQQTPASTAMTTSCWAHHCCWGSVESLGVHVGTAAYILTIHEPSLMMAVVVGLIMALLARWQQRSWSAAMMVAVLAVMVSLVVAGWLRPEQRVHIERVAS